MHLGVTLNPHSRESHKKFEKSDQVLSFFQMEECLHAPHMQQNKSNKIKILIKSLSNLDL